MADIVEFPSREAESENSKKEVVEEVLNIIQEVEALSIFIKTKSDDYILLSSSELSTPDKSFLVQMLQHEIFEDLSSNPID